MPGVVVDEFAASAVSSAVTSMMSWEGDPPGGPDDLVWCGGCVWVTTSSLLLAEVSGSASAMLGDGQHQGRSPMRD